MTSARLSRRVWLASASVLGLSAGCASMGLESMSSPFLGEEKTPPSAAESVQVEYRSASGKVSRKAYAVGPNDTVQTIVKQCEPARKFRRFTLELARRLPEGNANQQGAHKMKVEYDRAARRVSFEHDYAVQPGDMLIVNEDTSTVIDDMVKEGFGNVNPLKALGS